MEEEVIKAIPSPKKEGGGPQFSIDFQKQNWVSGNITLNFKGKMYTTKSKRKESSNKIIGM